MLLAAGVMSDLAQSPTELAEIWDKEHVTNKLPSNIRHAGAEIVS
jgi:hypothetical protein